MKLQKKATEIDVAILSDSKKKFEKKELGKMWEVTVAGPVLFGGVIFKLGEWCQRNELNYNL